MDSLVKDLLEATRISVGKARLEPEPFALRRLVAAALDTCAPALAALEQRVEVDVPETLRLEADYRRLQQVLVNVLANASKFSPRGAVIRLAAEARGDWAILRVTDPGRGIAPERLPHIFEVFQQGACDGAGAGDGLGLGLAVVRALVELHGGSVEATSAGAERGTQIVCRLPLCAPRDAA
jgi:signal transduction histidine kinase